MHQRSWNHKQIVLILYAVNVIRQVHMRCYGINVPSGFPLIADLKAVVIAISNRDAAFLSSSGRDPFSIKGRFMPFSRDRKRTLVPSIQHQQGSFLRPSIISSFIFFSDLWILINWFILLMYENKLKCLIYFIFSIKIKYLNRLHTFLINPADIK
ncbi:hypothetical protein QFZ72_001970 [Bacillus sp. V2I10]|nr:hypothetical protein [Bacillus sp. V2I10]